jgi:hypothetical protein
VYDVILWQYGCVWKAFWVFLIQYVHSTVHMYDMIWYDMYKLMHTVWYICSQYQSSNDDEMMIWILCVINIQQDLCMLYCWFCVCNIQYIGGVDLKSYTVDTIFCLCMVRVNHDGWIYLVFYHAYAADAKTFKCVLHARRVETKNIKKKKTEKIFVCCSLKETLLQRFVNPKDLKGWIEHSEFSTRHRYQGVS